MPLHPAMRDMVFILTNNIKTDMSINNGLQEHNKSAFLANLTIGIEPNSRLKKYHSSRYLE